MSKVKRVTAALLGFAMAMGFTTAITVVTAAPASAWVREAGVCEGDRVDRCLSIRRNSNGTVYVRASISDDRNRSGNYAVRVMDVCIRAEQYVNTCVDGRRGWADNTDAKPTNAYAMPCGTGIYGYAKYQWYNQTTGAAGTDWTAIQARTC